MKILNIKDLNNSLYNKLTSQAKIDGGLFLPSPIFTATPKFILIAMEPSIKGKKKSTDEIDKDLFDLGRINFLNSEQDIILNYCAYKYLCKGNFDYYLTDISKVPMLTDDANKDREQRYVNWFGLLKEELDYFGYLKSNVSIISIGNAVDKFLRSNGLEPSLNIIHYSWSASSHIIEYFNNNSLNYNAFEESKNNIIDFMEEIYQVNNIFEKERKTKRNFGSHVSEWKKMLFSVYKYEFEKLASKN